MPTHAKGHARRQDEIRLKNLVREAARQLAETTVSLDAVEHMLGALTQFPENSPLWRHRSEGLAIYSSEEMFRCFLLPMRCEEFVVVSDNFVISPLIPLLHANGRFFILALSKDSADLYEATRYSIAERDLPAMDPVSVDAGKPALQLHSHRMPSAGKGDTKEAVYHGHGGPEDRESADIANFFRRQVDPGVSDLLRGQKAPLVMACVDELAPLYREANSYPQLADDHVSGSPVEMSEDELHARAWKVIAPTFRQEEVKARNRFEALSGSELTRATAAPIVDAARRGRVDTLFLPIEIAASSFSKRSPEQTAHDTPEIDSTLLEEAVEQTLLFGGRVLAVEDVPGDSSLAAVLRY